MTDDHDPKFEALLQFLQQQRGFDFTGYKRPSLVRRVTRRVQTTNVADFGDYLDYLEVHPEEFVQLFNTVLINVTSFFRDEATWEYLRKETIPQLLAAKGPHDPVRIWSAGCASGQEAYTLAVCFAEALGAEGFRERVKVYGTDADEEALNYARLATYTEKEVENLESALVGRYFERVNGRFVFRPDLRRSVIFGRHDIVQDAPISRLDLLVCRNTLMYLNAETQAKILQRFHFALNGDGNGAGYLFLGRAEMPLSHGTLFTPLNLKCRVFAKVPQPGATARARPPVAAPINGNGNDIMRNDRLRELALDEAPVARIIVDANGTAVVQDPEDAMHRSMSINALDSVEVDYKLPVAEPPIAAEERERMEAEVQIARESDPRVEDVMQYGVLSPFTCPECHGVLTMFREGNILRFRCHTGHALSSGTLLEATTEQVEDRLMDAMRALDETIMLLNKLGEEYAKQGNTEAAEQAFNRARDAYERSRPIREAAINNEEFTTDDLRQQASS